MGGRKCGRAAARQTLGGTASRGHYAKCPCGGRGPRIGRLVVLGDEFELFSQNAAGFIDAIQCDLGACERIPADGGRRAAERKNHADLEGVRSASNAGEHRRRKARCEHCIEGPSFT